MIIHSLCNTCLSVFELLIEVKDLHLIKQISMSDGKLALCPRLCGGQINLLGEPTISAMAKDQRLRTPISLTGTELYRAVNGSGLPDEIPQSEETILALLKSNRVVDAKIEMSQGRFFIHEIKLDNGLMLHLGAGQKGAHVVKITRGVQ